MKNILNILLVVALVSFSFTSCEQETTAGLTRITYYPTLNVLGDAVILIDKGDAYVDPGCYAELNGEDVTDQVAVVSNVDASTPGIYSVSYKITNEDGFFVTGSRTVYVADPTPSPISTGMHTCVDGTHRITLTTGAKIVYKGFEMLILQVAPGKYYISDFLGGYYEQRLGYGSNYAMTGYFTLNNDNTLSLVSSYVAGWGDGLDLMKNATFDPVSGQISYSVEYAGFLEFNVILN